MSGSRRQLIDAATEGAALVRDLHAAVREHFRHRDRHCDADRGRSRGGARAGRAARAREAAYGIGRCVCALFARDRRHCLSRSAASACRPRNRPSSTGTSIARSKSTRSSRSAYAAKAREYAYSMGRDLPRRAGLNFEDRATLAIANAELALALDPDLGLAHAALANVHRLSGRLEEARRALERALALSPNDFQVLFDAVVLNFVAGSAEETMRYAQHAARINPAESFLLLGVRVHPRGRLRRRGRAVRVEARLPQYQHRARARRVLARQRRRRRAASARARKARH